MAQKEFWIRKKRNYYEVMYGQRVMCIADSEHEASMDIAKYKKDIEEYIDTGVMRDWRTAVFFS